MAEYSASIIKRFVVYFYSVKEVEELFVVLEAGPQEDSVPCGGGKLLIWFTCVLGPVGFHLLYRLDRVVHLSRPFRAAHIYIY